MNRYGLGPSEVGRLIGKDHATAIHSSKLVKDMLLTNNEHYVDEVVRWADVFHAILPNGKMSNIIIQSRLETLLNALTSDKRAMIKALDELREKISKSATHLDCSGVI